MPGRLSEAKRRVVGIKETTKAIQAGLATTVYIAQDAEERVVRPLKAALAHGGIEVVQVESMRALGRLCAIEVGAAAAAILRS